MFVDEILSHFDRVRPSRGGFEARCPAHDTHHGSLQIDFGEKGVLFHCRAGCSPEAILAAVGLDWADVFYEASSSRRDLPVLKPKSTPGKAVPARQEIEDLWDGGQLTTDAYLSLLSAWHAGAKVAREEKSVVVFDDFGEVVHYALKRKPERWGALPLGERA